jgi:glycosidase
MQMAANLYLLGPGSPFIYYGEELGMRGSRGGANTDANRRLAMLWNDEDTVQDPEGSTYKAQIEQGVLEQKSDPNSLYTYYKQLLMIRSANPEIARGDYTAVSFSGNRLGGFTSSWNGSTVCVLHNATDAEITVDLAKAGLDFSVLRAVTGLNDASLDGSVLTVGAMTSVVLK